MAKPSNPTPLDIMADAEDPETSAKDLAQAVAFADEMLLLESKILELEAQIKQHSSRYTKLQMELLPDCLLSIGVKKFSLSNGYIISVKDFVRGSFPSTNQIEAADEMDRALLIQRREAAMEWLKANNASSLIKNQVLTEFAAGQDDAAKALYAKIQAEGFKVAIKEEVNFATLNSYLKQALEAGKDVPVEPFGLFVGKKADLKAPKADKKKGGL